RQRLLDGWNGKIAQLATQIAGGRAALIRQQERQEQELRKARKPSVSATQLYALAEGVGKAETDLLRQIQPVLDNLSVIIARHAVRTSGDKIDRAIVRYAEETIDIGISFLEVIQNYRLECLKLASEKTTSSAIISSAEELEREFANLQG